MYDPNDPFNLKPLWPNINQPEMLQSTFRAEPNSMSLLDNVGSSAAAPEPLPEVGNPDPTNQKFLSEAYGIGTAGPQADMATRNAQNYATPSTPQQFGQDQDVSADEGPLTPQQTAEAMPATSQAMDKLIKQHMLGMPKAPTVSSDGRQNDLTAKREAEALEKEQRALRGDANRARTREKTSDAWAKTLLQNHLQGGLGGGMGSPGMGAPITSGGPSVQTIGGYKFVSGHMRPQTADEAARIRMMADNSQLSRDKLGLEREEIGTRERIAGKNIEVRTASDSADRGLTADRAAEVARHNRVMEERMQDQLDAKLTDKEKEEIEDDAYELEKIVQQMQARQGIADEQVKKGTRSYINPARILPDSLVGPNAPDRTPFLDDRRDPKDPSKFVREVGSYAFEKRRLAHLRNKLMEAKKAGKFKGDLPQELEALLGQ